MDNTVTNAIYVAAGVFLTIVIITIGIFLAKSGKTLSSSVNDRIISMNSSISDNSVLKYDSRMLTGSDVVNCIRKNRDSIEITVYKQISKTANPANLDTGYQKQTFDHETDSFINLPKYSDDDVSGNLDGKIYINPNARFLGCAERNGNDVITGLSFVQQEYVDDAKDRPVNNTTVIVNGSLGGSGGTAADVDVRLQEMEAVMSQLTDVMSDFIEDYYATGGGAAESVQAIQTLIESYFNAMTAPDTGVLSQISKKLDAIGDYLVAGGAQESMEIMDRLERLQNLLDEIQDMIASGIAGAADIEALQARLGEAVELSEDTGAGASSTEAMEGIEDVKASLSEFQEQVGTLKQIYKGMESRPDDGGQDGLQRGRLVSDVLSAINSCQGVLDE